MTVIPTVVLLTVMVTGAWWSMSASYTRLGPAGAGSTSQALLAGRGLVLSHTRWTRTNKPAGISVKLQACHCASLFYWRPRFLPGGFHSRMVIPLWMFLLPCLAWTLHGFFVARRRMPYECRQCGYDLTGIRGRCPECGNATARAERP